MTLLAGYLHLVMIAGVLGTSVAMEMTIDDPGEDGRGQLAVGVVGPALFLIARILLAAMVDGSRPWARLVGVPAIIVGGLATGELPATRRQCRRRRGAAADRPLRRDAGTVAVIRRAGESDPADQRRHG